MLNILYFLPDNYGRELGLSHPFLKGGNGSLKSLGDLFRVGHRFSCRVLVETLSCLSL